MAPDGRIAPVRLLGYWREVLPEGPEPWMSPEQTEQWKRLREIGLRWPDPDGFVDPGWDDEARAAVIRHLEVGTLVNQYRGLSLCRFCDCANGSAELTDGTYCWPEGLPHYVRVHAVRLPSEFVDHVMTSPRAGRGLPAPRFDDRLGQRDRSWPGVGHGQQLWAPADPGDGYGLTVEVDATWWLKQGSCSLTGVGIPPPQTPAQA